MTAWNLLYKEQVSDLWEEALTLQVHGKPESTGSTSKDIHNSLDKHYFGPWRALSEGWGDDLYLIDNQDKFHKIEVSKHSTDTKRFWGGRKIVEEEFFWFGPRGFPFDVSSDGDAAGKKPLDTIRNLLNLLKQQSKEELEQLSKHLDTRNDEELCEILDVFWKCWVVKDKFVRKNKRLQEEIDFKLSVVSTALAPVKLEGDVPTDDEWKAFAAVFKDMIKFNKLSSFQSRVAKYGMKWARERLTAVKNGEGKRAKNDSTGENQEIRDPVHFWVGVLKNKKLGYDCSDENSLFKDFFEECRDSNILGMVRTASGRAKMTHVLKSGSKCCSRDRRTYRISKKGGGSDWWDQHELKPGSKEEEEFLNQAKTKLVISGIAEEECRNLSAGLLDWLNVEKRFCHEVNKMFFGNTVNEKRFFVHFHLPNVAAATDELIVFLKRMEGGADGNNMN